MFGSKPARDSNPIPRAFYRFFSSLFPFNNHFCVISAYDGTLDYSHETKVALDLVTAHLLFGKGDLAKKTAQKIATAAQRVCVLWNGRHSDPKVCFDRNNHEALHISARSGGEGVGATNLLIVY